MENRGKLKVITTIVPALMKIFLVYNSSAKKRGGVLYFSITERKPLFLNKACFPYFIKDCCLTNDSLSFVTDLIFMKKETTTCLKVQNS